MRRRFPFIALLPLLAAGSAPSAETTKMEFGGNAKVTRVTD